MTRTLLASVHVRHLYAFCGHSPYVTTFRESSIALDRVTALEKKATFDYIFSTSTDRSVGLHLISLSLTAIEAVEKVKHQLTNKLHQFTSHISPARDQYVQYLLTGSIYRSLTDTGRGYKLRCVDLPYHTLQFSQLTVLHLLPKCPTRSQINHPTLPTGLKIEQILNLVSEILHSISTVSYHLSIACANGNHQDDRVIKDKPKSQS
jgi:hypothetical protein